MAILDWLTSPRGLALDRHLVRYTGHSLLNHAFARQAGIDVNPALVLRTQGRKSGLWRDVVLPWYGDSSARIVVGSNGGQTTNPAWVANLREHPNAEIFVDRHLHYVVARMAEGQEYERLWRDISTRVPVYADYQRQCEAQRKIPLIVLEPR